MPIAWSRFKHGKGTPRVVVKMVKAKLTAADERACRVAVDARDHRRCFLPGCRAFAAEKHHIVPSSVAGVRRWVTADILSSCAAHHRWFKAGLIRVVGNPDRGPVRVVVTALGREAGIRIPRRAA